MNSRPVKKGGQREAHEGQRAGDGWSNHEYGRAAAKTPTGRAISSASSCDRPITTSVTGAGAAAIRVSTSIALTNEKAPVALQHSAQPVHVAPARSGSSRPNCARMFSRTSAGTFGLVPRSSKRVARRQRQHGEQHDADAQQAGQRDQQDVRRKVAIGRPCGRALGASGRVSRRRVQSLQRPEASPSAVQSAMSHTLGVPRGALDALEVLGDGAIRAAAGDQRHDVAVASSAGRSS